MTSYSMYTKNVTFPILVLLGILVVTLYLSYDIIFNVNKETLSSGIDGIDPVVCSRQVKIVPDKSLDDALKSGPYDVVVCPGGAGGANNLCQSAAVGNLLQEQEKGGRYVAAICAGPTALKAHKICGGKTVTSYPSMKDKMVEGGYKYSEDRVVNDGKVITSRGPGTTFEFALKIVEKLQGAEKANSLVSPMLVKM